MSYKYQQCPACFEFSQAADYPACPFCGFEILGINHHPWRRFFARWVDFSFILIFWFIIVIITIISLNPSPQAMQAFQAWMPNLDHPIISYPLLGVLYVFTEALLLSWYGNTPGKKLYRIKLNYAPGGKPPFLVALKRTFMMWAVGMAMGIPIVTFFALYLARKRLVKTGVTLWDAEGGFHVSHGGWGRGYGIWVFLVSLVAIITFMLIYSADT